MWLLIFLNLAGKVAACLIGGTETLTAITVWVVPDLLLAYHVFAPDAQGLVRMHRRFNTPRREVWLTIDDGPDAADTPRILACLAAFEARATFFVIGEEAVRHPDIIRAIVAAGHEVAHHTHTHPISTFWFASRRSLRRELDEGTSALEVLAVRPTRFRPPAGFKNFFLAGALRARGLVCVGWSTRGLERWHGDPAKVAARATRGLSPGAIILMHEGPRVPAPVRVEAIRCVLERLNEQRYRCVIPAPEQLID